MTPTQASPVRRIMSFGWGGPSAHPLVGWFFTLGFCVAVVLGTLDFRFSFSKFPLAEVLTRWMAVWVVIAAALDREPIDTPGPFRRRAAGLALWVAMITIGAVALCAAYRMNTGPVLRHFTRSVAPWLWLVDIWLALPLLFSRRHRPLVRAGVWTLMLYGSWALLSCVISVERTWSAHWFIPERAVPFGVLLCWLRSGATMPRAGARAAVFAVAFWLLFMFSGAALGALDRFGPPIARIWTERNGLAYAEYADVVQKLDYPPRRQLFPMLNINRLGWQTMVITFLLLAASQAAKARPGGWNWRRALCLAGAAAGIVPLICCGTRGTLLATMAGVAFAAALCSRRTAGWALGAMLLMAAGVGATGQRHLKMVLDPKTYNGDGPLTSMQARMLGWRFGLSFVAANPLAGGGYGYKNVKEAYQNFVNIEGSQRELDSLHAGVDLQHLHNLWLEIAAESGLPALAFFVAFLILRWPVLARAWRAGPQARRAMAPWCGGELAIMLGGVLFYMVKQNSGTLTWLFWFHALAVEMNRPGTGEVADAALAEGA